MCHDGLGVARSGDVEPLRGRDRRSAGGNEMSQRAVRNAVAMLTSAQIAEGDRLVDEWTAAHEE
tara:strand:- start:25 stop:216 length:192 start_codon:yes stop_codon:yes gene_type:complete